MLLNNPKIYSQTKGNYFIPEKFDRRELINKPFQKFLLQADSTFITNLTLAGKVVYINYWFAACPPCREEMPLLNRIFDRFKSDTNFVFMSVTLEEREKINWFKEFYNIKYNIYSNRQNLALRNKTGLYPAHVVIDKRGVVRVYDVGGINQRYLRKTLYPTIERLLNDK